VIDRSRFRIDPAAVTRVSIVRAGVRQAFKSDGARLVRAGAGPDAADDPLADALAAFSSEAAIHIGPPAPGEGFDHPALEIEAATPGDAGGAAGARITVGGQGRDGPLDVYFARVTGVDATFSIARPIVDAILDATHAL
jgi:hypothetical protein